MQNSKEQGAQSKEQTTTKKKKDREWERRKNAALTAIQRLPWYWYGISRLNQIITQTHIQHDFHGAHTHTRTRNIHTHAHILRTPPPS